VTPTIYDELDPFDSIDEAESELEGFHIVELDTDSGDGYTGGDIPFCDFGLGDSDGLCIRNLYGCHVEGCEHASPNWM
jgi:hypothetical protein